MSKLINKKILLEKLKKHPNYKYIRKLQQLLDLQTEQDDLSKL